MLGKLGSSRTFTKSLKRFVFIYEPYRHCSEIEIARLPRIRMKLLIQKLFTNMCCIEKRFSGSIVTLSVCCDLAQSPKSCYAMQQ